MQPDDDDQPLYPHVLVGYESNDRGGDAKLLGELIVRAVGGELTVLNVDDADPAEVLRRMAERGDADLIVLGSTHRAFADEGMRAVCDSLVERDLLDAVHEGEGGALDPETDETVGYAASERSRTAMLLTAAQN